MEEDNPKNPKIADVEPVECVNHFTIHYVIEEDRMALVDLVTKLLADLEIKDYHIKEELNQENKIIYNDQVLIAGNPMVYDTLKKKFIEIYKN